MLTARDRLRIIRSRTSPDLLRRPRLLRGAEDRYPLIPQGTWRAFRDYIYVLLARLRYICLVSLRVPSPTPDPSDM
jgi:hypothetical protein